MSRCRITPLAEQDLCKIWDYIAQDNPTAATRLVNNLLDAAEMLSHRPLLGQRHDELLAGLRAFMVRRFVIYYRLEGDGIYVLRIVHGARDQTNLF